MVGKEEKEVAGMFMEKNTNVQDEYIEELKKKGANITIILTSTLNHKLLFFLSLNDLTTCTLPKVIHTS